MSAHNGRHGGHSHGGHGGHGAHEALSLHAALWEATREYEEHGTLMPLGMALLIMGLFALFVLGFIICAVHIAAALS